jgi:hypothetical protein
MALKSKSYSKKERKSDSKKVRRREGKAAIKPAAWN